MRKLVAILIFLAVLVVALSVADVYVRHRVEHDTADRIEQRVPGTHAAVHISSFPFVLRLAASGAVPHLTADVTGASVGGLSFADIHLDVRDLRIQRSSLFQGDMRISSVKVAVVNATITQAAIDKVIKLPVTLGAGTVGLEGVVVPVTPRIDGKTIVITVAKLPTLRVVIPALALLPCLSSASILPGALELSCTTSTIPPALASAAISTP